MRLWIAKIEQVDFRDGQGLTHSKGDQLNSTLKGREVELECNEDNIEEELRDFVEYETGYSVEEVEYTYSEHQGEPDWDDPNWDDED